MFIPPDEISAKLAPKRSNSSESLHFDERHMRLPRALDSYGHYKSDNLSGKTHIMGHHGHCGNTHLLLKSGADGDGARRPLEVVPKLHCWAFLSVDKHLHENLKHRKGNFKATMTNL